MKSILFTFTLLFSVICYSQVIYEPGYIVDNSGTKIDCFIKNSDWASNPSKFSYKMALDAEEVLEGNLELIKEFAIGNKFKYQRLNVDIDQSKNKVSKMSSQRAPEFKNETVFLKLLVQGDVNLLTYKNNQFQRFFLQRINEKVQPLIYKKYKLNSSKIATNDSYRKVIYETLVCSEITLEETLKLEYEKENLVAFFSKYNLCSSGEVTKFEGEKGNGDFNFKAKAGVMYTSMNVSFDEQGFQTNINNATFDSKLSLRLGVEIEYVFPVNRNKWSVFIEPNYQNFKSDGQTDPNETLFSSQELSVNYSYIEIPLGVRHYLFLNNSDQKIFLNLAYVFTLDLGSEEVVYSQNANLSIKSRPNVIFGIGYQYQNFSLEARLATSRNIVSDNNNYSTNYSNVGLIFGYNIL